MDIKQLVTKPQIVELEVNTPEIIDLLGESVIFYMRDHLELSTYFDFYKLQQNNDVNELMKLMRTIVLNKDGQPAIAEDEVLPVEITLAILFKINDFLGKSKAKASMTKAGKGQN